MIYEYLIQVFSFSFSLLTIIKLLHREVFEVSDNDKYFRLKLISSKGLISIHEKLVLSPSEYHHKKNDDSEDRGAQKII